MYVNDIKQKAELFFSLLNIANQDNSYKIIMQLCNNKNKNYDQVYESDFSETGLDSFPFPSSFVFTYFFEKEQFVKLIIVDGSGRSKIFDTKVSSIMGARKSTLRIQDEEYEILIEGKGLQGEEFDLSLTIECPSFNTEGSLIFYVVSNFNDKKHWREVYKSEEKPPNSGYFDIINLDSHALCGSDINNPILLEFYNANSFTKIGGGEAVIANALNNPQTQMNSTQGGFTCNVYIKRKPRLTFTQLLSQGLQISLIIGVDFTLSNGHPEKPDSLHFLNGPEPNPYERAIMSCGSIVANYDYDQLFPMLGFGGIPSGRQMPEHVFPLNYNFQGNPEVLGVQGMLDAYRESLCKTKLSGPTYFAPMIRNVSKMVKLNMQSDSEQVYYILMMLTDGQINDMDQTIEAIIEAAKLPISIIIIGIGADDFTNMDILDGDDEPLVSNNEVVKRDIVQFVEFRKFEGDGEKLASEVLEEIPRQVEQYYIDII